MKSSALRLLIFATVLPSCSTPVGPNYQTPEAPLPARWSRGQTAKAHGSKEWWKAFGDAELNRITALAQQENQDLIKAMHRVDEAQASLRFTRAQTLPTLVLSGEAQVRQASENAPASSSQPPMARETTENYQMGRGLQYEVDLWGKVRRSVEAKEATLDAIEYARLAVQLRVTGQVAEQYFSYHTLQAEEAVLREAITLRQQTLAITQKRYSGGLTSESDVTRATSALSSAEADRTETQRKKTLILHQLAELCGQPAGRFSLRDTTPPSSHKVRVKLASPATVLNHRPDVAEAERTLAARSAEIGAIMAEKLPSLKFNAHFSLESISLADLLDRGSRRINFGPEISWPAFDGGANRARVREAQARYEQAAATWRSTVLTVVREVEDALQDQQAYEKLIQHQQTNVTAAERTTRLTLERYRQGLITYLEVVEAQREELSARRQLIQAQSQHRLATAQLLRAIGGM
jgi:outer membrane protein, multidrug efflux system